MLSVGSAAGAQFSVLPPMQSDEPEEKVLGVTNPTPRMRSLAAVLAIQPAAQQQPQTQSTSTPTQPRAAHALALTPTQAVAVFNAVHGAGNARITAADIQAWLTHPRTPQEILRAMVEHGVCAAQVGRALGWAPERVQQVLVDYGLDVQTLAHLQAAQWSARDFERAATRVTDLELEVERTGRVLAQHVGRVEILMQEARRGETAASQARSEFEALDAVFAPAWIEYTALVQERDRTDGINARIQAMQAWGQPLMERTQAARAHWERAQVLATERSEIAWAQAALAQSAADAYRAAITELSALHEQRLTYARNQADRLRLTQAQRDAQGSMDRLEALLPTQRAWTDAARERSAQLDARAVALEDEALRVAASAEPAQLRRLDAEALIQARRTEAEDARQAQQHAQSALEQAYRRRVEADRQRGKGTRNRARDEAGRLIVFHTQQLTPVTEQAQAAQAAWLVAVQGADAVRLAGLHADSQSRRAAVLAGGARQQALAQAMLGVQWAEVEWITCSALRLGGRSLQAQATADRAAARQEVEHFIGLAGQAHGEQLVLEHLSAEATYVHEVAQGIDLAGVNAQRQAAEQRLVQAQWAERRADMHMDWAQSKVDPKRQAKAMGRAQPALVAAREALTEAQQAADEAHAAWRSAQPMARSLTTLAHESDEAVRAATQRAQVHTLRAGTQALWAEVAQRRALGSGAVTERADEDAMQVQQRGVQVLREALHRQAERAAVKYREAQDLWSHRVGQLDAANVQVGADRQAAEQAWAQMSLHEQQAHTEFVAVRGDFDKRRSQHKQLRWLDDRAQFIERQPQVVAAREHSRRAVQAVEHSSESALDAAAAVHAAALNAALRGALWQGRVERGAQDAQAPADIQRDTKVRDVAAQTQAQSLSQVAQTYALARWAQRELGARVTVAQELHEQRLRFDRVHNKRKEKSLFATLVHGAALVAAAAMSYFVPPLGLALGENLLAAAAVGAGVNAAAQGVNVAAGFQERWDNRSMVAMASVGLFGAVMGTVANTTARALRGTILGSAVAATPSSAAIPAGALSWVGTALGWGAGAAVAGVAQQGFEVATGASTKFSWRAVHTAALRQGLGGVMRLHWASSWAGSPFLPTLYRPMSVSEMVQDVGRRVLGNAFIDSVLYGAGLVERFDANRLLTVAAGRGVQMVTRDAFGRYVVTSKYPAAGDFVGSTLGQSLIRSGVYLTQAAVDTAWGQSADWVSTLYLGVGRATGQLGSSWGDETVKALTK